MSLLGKLSVKADFVAGHGASSDCSFAFPSLHGEWQVSSSLEGAFVLVFHLFTNIQAVSEEQRRR